MPASAPSAMISPIKAYSTKSWPDSSLCRRFRNDIAQFSFRNSLFGCHTAYFKQELGGNSPQASIWRIFSGDVESFLWHSRARVSTTCSPFGSSELETVTAPTAQVG